MSLPSKVEMARMCLAEVGYSPDQVSPGRNDRGVGVTFSARVPLDVGWRIGALIAFRTGDSVACLACYHRWPKPSQIPQRLDTCTADRLGVLDCGADRA